MPLLPLLFDRMIDAAVMSFMLLVLGTLGVLCCRQPVRRMRIIVVTLAGCLIAPVVSALPGIPHWSIPRGVRSTGNIDRGGQAIDLTESTEIKEPGVAGVEAQRSPQRMPELDLNGTEAPLSDRLVERDPENPGANLVPRETSEDIAHDSLEQPSAGGERPAFASTSVPLAHYAPTPSLASNFQPDAPGATALAASAAPDDPVDAGDVRADGPSTIVETPDSIFRLPSIVASYRATILVLYTVGLAAITAWWLVGLVGLLRVLAVARPAPPPCRRLLREIAGPTSDRVRLLVSPRAAQPFTFAWRHSVIVLPTESHDIRALQFADPSRDGSSKCVETVSRRSAATPLQAACPSSNNPPLPNDALRSALAHEWSHIARGDVWIWSFAGLVRLVYYYQPLCWWLRRQLRLCRDFLADSDAARQSSPTEYAEFLATRALGHPLALGLGITAGKSDLYRRVAMLVRNQRPLEAHSPVWWNTLVGTVALGVLVVAATFGLRTETRADSVEVAHESSIGDDVSGNPSAERISSPSDSSVPSNGPFETERAVVAAVDSAAADSAAHELRAIISGLLTPRKLPTYVRVRTTAKIRDIGGNKPWEVFQIEEVFGNGSWREQIASRPLSHDRRMQTEVLHGDRYWRIVETPKHDGTYERSVSAISQIPTNARLRAALPTVVVSPLPRSTRTFIEQNSDDAKLKDLVEINELRSRIVEWDVTDGLHISGIFVLTDEVTSKTGGTLRLYVAPESQYVVTRVEHIDHVGKVQASIDALGFAERLPGVMLPREVRARFNGIESEASIDAVEEIAAAEAEKLFAVDSTTTPQGTIEKLGATPRADASANVEKPIITVAIPAADALFEDLQTVFDMVGDAKGFTTLKNTIEVFLVGIDSKTPSRLRLYSSGGDLKYVLSLPVPGPKQFKDLLLNMWDLDLKTAPSPTPAQGPQVPKAVHAGVRKLMLDPKTERMMFNTFDGFLRFESAAEQVHFGKELPEVRRAKGGLPADFLKGRDLAVFIDGSVRTPTERRADFAKARKEILGGLVMGETEHEATFALRKALTEQQLGEVERFFADAEKIDIGWTTASSRVTGAIAAKGSLAINLTAIVGTSLERSIEQFGQTPDEFAGVGAQGVALKGTINFPLDEMRKGNLKTISKLVRDDLKHKVEADEKLTRGQKQVEQDLVELMFDVVDDVATSGLVNGFARVWPNGNSTLTLTGGVKVPDGANVVKVLQTIAERDGGMKVALKAETEGDVDIHKLSLGGLQKDYSELLDKDGVLFVGTAPTAVWVAAGHGALDRLKQAIREARTAGSQAGPTGELTVQLYPLIEAFDKIRTRQGPPAATLAKSAERKPVNRKAADTKQEGTARERATGILADLQLRKLALEAFQEGKDTLSLTLQREEKAVQLDVRLDEGILRLVGKALSKFVKDNLADD